MGRPWPNVPVGVAMVAGRRRARAKTVNEVDGCILIVKQKNEADILKCAGSFNDETLNGDLRI